MKFSLGVRHVRRENQLDCGGSPDSFVDLDHHFHAGFFSISIRAYNSRCCHLANVYELMLLLLLIPKLIQV